MANGLQFSGNGYATSGIFWQFLAMPLQGSSPGAVELYLNTTTANQTFFSAQDTLSGYGRQISFNLIIYSDENANINVSVAGSNYTYNCSVNDGNWHQISLYFDMENYNLFVDGVPLPAASAERKSPARESGAEGLNYTLSGSVYFGADQVSDSPLAPAFTGLMTELRLWQGGNSWTLISNPAFSLNVGVPVSSAAPTLLAYWPFWTNQSTPLADQCHQAVLTLNGVTQVGSLPQVYDDLSEVICNGALAAFNPFTAGNEALAFTYIMTQSGINLTLAAFRSRYTQESYSDNFSIYYTQIKAVPFPNNGQFDLQDFDTVQTQLLNELAAATNCWGYYQTALNNFTFLTQQYQSAQNVVYETIFSTSMISGQSASSDAGNIINAVATVASLIPEVGKAVAALLKIVWAAANFSTSNNPEIPINFTQSLVIEADIANYQQQVTNAINLATGNVQGSICMILGNGGLLQTVSDRINNGLPFQFSQNLNPDQTSETGAQVAQAALAATFNSAQLVFSQLLLCAGYSWFQVSAQVEYDGQINAPLFQYSPYSFGTNIIGWQNGTTMYNGEEVPVLVTPQQPVASLLMNAATALNPAQQLQLEMFECWPYPVVVPNDSNSTDEGRSAAVSS